MSTTDHRSPSPAHPLVQRLLDLWAGPIRDPDEARAAFAELYADPVTINGTELALEQLIDRSARMHLSLERTGVRVIDVVATSDKVVVAFEITARHIGTWHSPLGDLAATGRTVKVRTIDILTVTEGLITDIVVNSDEVALLTQLGATVHWSADGAPSRERLTDSD